MSTAASSTDPGRLADAVRAVVDVRHLLRFRLATTRRRWSVLVSLVLVLGLTSAAVVVPTTLPGAGTGDRAFDVLLLMPTALAGFLALAIVSATASSGGREMLARDPASVLPISPTTDHLGALLLAPLNIAWVIQTWMLLGSTAYALGWRPLLVQAEVLVLLWVAAATAVAQGFAWGLESARRVPHGVAGVRALVVGVFGAALGLQVAGQLLSTFDQVPTQPVVVGMVTGDLGAVRRHRRRPRRAAGRGRRPRRRARALRRPPGAARRDRSRGGVVRRAGGRLAPRCWRWSAPTGPRCGGRSRCGAASSCSRSAPRSWPCSATSPGAR